MRFTVAATDGHARLGRLETAHGVVETPAFMPVGTLGAVKGVTPQELAAAGASVMLANLYHLALRPGIEVIRDLGGLHAFTGWQRAILTDSGGFQVFSLAHRRKIDEQGVAFKSHLDGATLAVTPESVVRMQQDLGVDIAMMLDECPPWPVDHEAARVALERTTRWARRALEVPRQSALFGIVQGSVYRDLRLAAVEALAELPFDGFAIGGVAVGEPLAERRAVVELVAPALPADRPRYLMGVGYPRDLLHAVRQGVDLFDCVLPARNARHGVLFTRQGVLRMKNAAFRNDPRPPDPDCGCPLCTRLSRAFLHHLMRAGEITAAVLATLHNVRLYLDFMAEIRHAISVRRLADWGERFVGDEVSSPA